MIEKEIEFNAAKFGEENFVAPVTSLEECRCESEHRLMVALSEQRGRPVLFAPDHKGIGGAYCATHGRRCGV